MHINPWAAFYLTVVGMWVSAGADCLHSVLRLRRLRRR